ncbi:COX15/CtaA family protein [Aeromonas diversa]|uniref:COX15/CtaA family protein n=1 Tax=Aeromonas diversa TaxID=502790 RepID=UPI003462F12F
MIRTGTLLILAIGLATLVIGLGAYTRLTDAGLGCPDWPGCYGKLTLPHPEEAPRLALSHPERPLEPHKARNEMIHRYAAGSLGMLLLMLFVVSWREARRLPPLPTCLLLLVVGQALLGMLTVTAALHPLIVMGHLLGGFALLTLLWLSLTRSLSPLAAPPWLKRLGALALLALLLQIALGGWTSANYAAMACSELPLCQGEWHQQLSLTEAFHLPLGHASYEFGVLGREARQTIHIGHRLGALLATLALLVFSLGLLSQGARASAALILALLLCQLLLGIANVVFILPLPNALAHNLVAAHLLIATAVTCRRLTSFSPRRP